jgi:hypothetical protein
MFFVVRVFKLGGLGEMAAVPAVAAERSNTWWAMAIPSIVFNGR